MLEDTIPSTADHGTAGGLLLKEVLEHNISELNVQGLWLAFNTSKVTEQLRKQDRAGFCTCTTPKLTWLEWAYAFGIATPTSSSKHVEYQANSEYQDNFLFSFECVKYQIQ